MLILLTIIYFLGTFVFTCIYGYADTSEFDEDEGILLIITFLWPLVLAVAVAVNLLRLILYPYKKLFDCGKYLRKKYSIETEKG